MLEQLGKHGGFGLACECRGDLQSTSTNGRRRRVALGQALREALGDKRGIQRYGFLLPMDEADAEVSIDLGGRPYLVFEGSFPRDRVGDLPTELVPHFFRSLAETLGAAVHVRVRGENTHHMVEVCFKGVARRLRQAFVRAGDELPTTKGTAMTRESSIIASCGSNLASLQFALARWVSTRRSPRIRSGCARPPT